MKLENSEEITNAAQDLFDNRLGWSEGRNPYAPIFFWDKLEKAIYSNQINEGNK